MADSAPALSGYFGAVPRELARDPKVSDRAVRLYAVLADYASTNKDSQAWPSRRRLAGDLGWSDDKVSRALAELEAAGWITRTERRREDRGRSSDLITVRTPLRNSAEGGSRGSAEAPSAEPRKAPSAQLRRQEGEPGRGRTSEGDRSAAPQRPRRQERTTRFVAEVRAWLDDPNCWFARELDGEAEQDLARQTAVFLAEQGIHVNDLTPYADSVFRGMVTSAKPRHPRAIANKVAQEQRAGAHWGFPAGPAEAQRSATS